MFCIDVILLLLPVPAEWFAGIDIDQFIVQFLLDYMEGCYLAGF